MSSSVFYKFKNSREPERIIFDGTDITVFELKREIITVSGLGDGTDFDLHLYPEDDPKTEYNDDTTTISRSSTVIAVRRPAARGHGRAARYVSGKAPVRAIKKDNKPTAPVAGNALNEADAEAAFLAESAQVWDAQKASLSNAKPVFHKKKPVVVPSHDPPPGYVCRRCNIKGHWIQACPTNDDPDFKPVFQAKRTTGIPQSFLKKVEKPVDEEAAKGIMLNADGEYVQVMTDTKTWEKFQEKTNVSKAQAASADAFSQELRARGLECPMDKRKFVDPVKTPCCGKTYCHQCIDEALANGDLVCPNCSKEDILMDDLIPDEEIIEKLKAFDAEKAKEAKEAKEKLEKEEQAKAEAKEAEQPASPPKNETENSVPVETSTTVPNDTSSVTVAAAAAAAAVAKPALSSTPGAGGNGSDTESTSSKKRKSPPTDVMPPTAPKAMRQQKEQEARLAANPAAQLEQDFIQQMEALKNAPMNMNMNMPMQMPPQMPMMNNNHNNMPYQNMGYQMPFNNNNGGGNNMGGFYNNGGGHMQMPMHMAMQMQMPMGMAQQQQFNLGFMPQQQQQNMHQFHGQQQDWGQQQGGNEAYDRQPVNPRHRNRKSRAPDYRYL